MFQINENSKKCHQLRKLSKELGECDEGLINLENTYGKDVRINAELEQIKDKFKEQIKKIEKALKLIDEEERKLLGKADSSHSSSSTLQPPPRINHGVYESDDDSESDNVHRRTREGISIDPFD
jgi:hypothetical protein